MGEITIKPFRMAHLDIFKVVESHKAECKAATTLFSGLADRHQLATHMIDGRIIYIAGYFQVLPGVLEVFMHPSIYLKDHKFAVIRYVRWWLDHMAREHKARRIQTWGMTNPESDKWLRSLGFVEEGVLNSYLLDGSPVKIWGKLY